MNTLYIYSQSQLDIDCPNRFVISQKKYLLLSTVGGDYARAGKHKKAQEILDTLLELPEENAVDPLMLAEIYAGLDQKEKAFSYLEKGYDIRSGLMIYLKVYSQTFLKNLSSDPRYTELLKKMGFEK